MVNNELLYTIALSMISGIGHIKARKIIEHCEGAEIAFKEFPKLLKKLSREKNSVRLDETLELAKTEIDFLHKKKGEALIISDERYPKRLKECADCPIVLYTQGKMDLNKKTIISIVGSRNATILGKEFCKKLVADLSIHDPLIVSGLAYGIDICAHQAAMDNGLETIGVIGSGLSIIYPQKHSGIANKMMEKGGLVSDYPSETKLLPSQFAERNRIVAGLSDATIVVESSVKGGSMITAGLANDYNREVFAVPGRVSDELSSGCNLLIKENKAALIESAADVEKYLGLDSSETGSVKKAKQINLFQDLDEKEQSIVEEIEKFSSINIDDLSINCGLSSNETSVILLELEFKGIVRSLPGKIYQIV